MTEGARPAARHGSSFPSGARRGTDPEGGERSAWKGLCGPSGLNLDHSRIPDIQRTVYEHLVPLVVAVPDPIPLSTFTQKCCDVLLPVLEKGQDLTAHAFKSQFGRLNEFVTPELARRAGLADAFFNREAKTVRLDLKVPLASKPARKPHRASASPLTNSGAAGAAPAASGSPAASAAVVYWTPAEAAPGTGGAPAVQQAVPPGLPMPISLQQSADVDEPPPGFARAPTAVLMTCAYCHRPHAMRECREFHVMLQAVYKAGVQHGFDAAGGSQQASPAPMTTSSDDSPPR